MWVSTQHHEPVKSKINKKLLQFSPCLRSACKSSQNGTPWERRKWAQEREVTRLQRRLYKVISKIEIAPRPAVCWCFSSPRPTPRLHLTGFLSFGIIQNVMKNWLDNTLYHWHMNQSSQTWDFLNILEWVCLPRQVPAWPMASMAYSTFEHSFRKHKLQRGQVSLKVQLGGISTW